MKPRICFFLPSLNGGGAQRVVIEVANGLSRRGWCIDLVVAKNEGQYFGEVSPEVHLVSLGCSRTITSVWALATYLRKARPSALCSALPHGCVVAWLATCVATTRTRFLVRETNSAKTPGSKRGKMQRLILAMCRFVYRRADLVIAPSMGVAAELPYDHTTHIPNPIDRGRILSEAAAPMPHISRRFILAVGEFRPQKRFHDLIKAYAALPDRDAFSLVILGDGELRSELTAIAQAHGLADSLVLPGFDPNPFRYMAQCDVFVLSSGWEGLPNVLLQAMACGAPIVATDCPHGPREVLQDGRFGELVPVGDVPSMTAAIKRQLARGRVAYPAEALADFDHDRIIGLWEEAFTD